MGSTVARGSLSLGVWALPSGSIAETGQNSVRTRFATLRYSRLGAELLRDVGERVDRGVEKVCGYLHATPPERLEVRLSDRPGIPVAHRDTGTIVIPTERLPDRAAIVHELTHIIAGPSKDDRGILDEGLAVYLQEKFGGPHDRSFPTGGRDLHEETVRLMAQCAGTVPLAGTARLRQRTRRGLLRTLAYLQEGSFTRLLVERFGLEPVMLVHRGEAAWLDAFGLTAEALEDLWLAQLSCIRDRMLPDGAATDDGRDANKLRGP